MNRPTFRLFCSKGTFIRILSFIVRESQFCVGDCIQSYINLYMRAYLFCTCKNCFFLQAIQLLLRVKMKISELTIIPYFSTQLFLLFDSNLTVSAGLLDAFSPKTEDVISIRLRLNDDWNTIRRRIRQIRFKQLLVIIPGRLLKLAFRRLFHFLTDVEGTALRKWKVTTSNGLVILHYINSWYSYELVSQ